MESPVRFIYSTAPAAQCPATSGNAGARSSAAGRYRSARARLPAASPAVSAMWCARPSAAGSAAVSAPVRLSKVKASAARSQVRRSVGSVAPLTASTAQKAIEAAGTISESTRANIASAEEAATQKKAEEEEARQQAEQEAQWQAEQQAQQQYANNYYIIPDSSSRYLSRSELEGYSTYDLYLARNEIYARYGRLFVNQDLQDYFWSQAWYNGYIAPDSFDASWMSDVDRQNATLMRQIEEERNSPYL